MKTPKRHSGNPRAVDLYAQRHSRWKRKNRLRQLKNTITKQRKEIEYLKAALRCVEFMSKHTQCGEGCNIFIPTLKLYTP